MSSIPIVSNCIKWKEALSDQEQASKGEDSELFSHNNTKEEIKDGANGEIDNSVILQQQHQHFVPKIEGSSSRRYRKQSKNKFKGKNIDTDFNVQRNDPLMNINNLMSNNMSTNQTMPMFASSNVVSPTVGNMSIPKGFAVSSTTKNIKFSAASRRPVSAVMATRMSPHSSVELPMFDLNRMRPRNIKRDKMSLYDDAMKLK
jgi:hypothetical protein